MNKTLLTILAVVVIAGGVWWSQKDGFNTPSVSTSASPTRVANASKTPSVGGVKSSPSVSSTPAPTQVLSYTQLVEQFGSNRIQFDQSCQATPKSFSLKNGTNILLDNRSSVTRTITVNGKPYALGAYGYQVITVSSPSLPKTVSVNCNDQVNSATINLQANISGE